MASAHRADRAGGARDGAHSRTRAERGDRTDQREQGKSGEQRAPARPTRRSFIEWLEYRSQPYIVASMALVAVVRGFYLFTDKLINLSYYPLINGPVSLVTGILLSGASELTITIAGRRHKLYKQQLYNAQLALASCAPRQRAMWDVEVKRLHDQVRANVRAMWISMGMSLLAAASYLIDSTGAAGFVAFAVATALAGYVLFLMYYHGVQTDKIKDDTTAQTAEAIRAALDAIRIEEVGRLRESLRGTGVGPGGRIALIASGLPIPDQRNLLPIVRLLLRLEDATEESNEPEEGEGDGAARWLSTRDIALRKGDDLTARKADDVMRKYRRRLSMNARRYPDQIRLDPVRGWLIAPALAMAFFDLSLSADLDGLAGRIVDARDLRTLDDGGDAPET